MANDAEAQEIKAVSSMTAPTPLPPELDKNAPSSVPADFSGWDKLYVKEGDPIPPGWTNMVSKPSVTMLTPEGSQSGEVPLEHVAEAREAGHHVAVPMTSPSGENGWVPLKRAHEAFAAGYDLWKRGAEKASAALANVTSLGMLPAFEKSPLGQKTEGKLNQMIGDIEKEAIQTITDPDKRVRFLVGLVNPGTEFAGPAEEAAEEAARAVVGKTPSGNPIHVPPRRSISPEIDKMIDEGGGIPGGLQKGAPEEGIPDFALFHDPKSGSSLMIPIDQVSPEAVKAHLETSRAQYAKAEQK